jgi:hypothetical protein
MTEYVSIDDLIAEHERDPVMAECLRQARIRLAPILHAIAPDADRFERMARGEGPQKCATTTSS